MGVKVKCVIRSVDLRNLSRLAAYPDSAHLTVIIFNKKSYTAVHVFSCHNTFWPIYILNLKRFDQDTVYGESMHACKK